MKQLKISIIIPTFNAQSTILDCLKSLQQQTINPLEIIVVDDGSTDNSKLKIQKAKLQFKMQNLILLQQKHQGAAAARNLGAKKAQGDLLVFTDSDCAPGKNWLKNIIRAFSDPQVGAVGGGYNSGADNSFWQKFCLEELRFRQKDRPKEVTTLLSSNFACLKTAYLKTGGFPKHYHYGEDMLLSYNISHCYKLLWLKDNGVKHHFKNSLMTYLKHQYLTGKGSTKFFLEYPQILLTNHYQGKRLHLAIFTSFLFLVSIITSIISPVFLILSTFFLLIHLGLYLKFFFYLKKKMFSNSDILQTYFVSLLRDLICTISIFDGFVAYLTNKV